MLSNEVKNHKFVSGCTTQATTSNHREFLPQFTVTLRPIPAPGVCSHLLLCQAAADGPGLLGPQVQRQEGLHSMTQHDDRGSSQS